MAPPANATAAPPRRRRLLLVLLIVVGLTVTVPVALLGLFELGTGLLRGEMAMRDGDQLLADKKFQEAIARYDRAIELRPNLARAYHGRAVARSQLMDHDGAIADARRALELSDGDTTFRQSLIGAYSRRAHARAEAGDVDGAVDDYEEAYKRDPSNIIPRHNAAIALHDRGCVRLNQGDLGGAEDVIRAYQFVPEDSERAKMRRDYGIALGRRGSARLSAGDLNGAVDDLTEAARVQPDAGPARDQAARALGQRSRARLGKGESDAALDDCERAIALYADRPKEANPKPRYLRRSSNGVLVDAHRLGVDYQSLIPARAEAYFNRGAVREKGNDLAGAAADYAQAIALYAEYADAYAALCLVRLNQGDLAEAELLRESFGRLLGPEEARALQRKMDAILNPKRL
jgi:tetratricopeptide (TPR) repeat protein